MRRFLPLLMILVSGSAAAAGKDCDKSCLEQIAAKYHAAWLAHNPAGAPFASKTRFVENNVEMTLPDGSWDTVTESIGTPLVLSDPKTGQVGLYTTVLQSRETQTYAAIRLRVEKGQITEVEHVLSTKRNLSAPPTPFGDVYKNPRDPDFTRVVPQAERATRDALKAQANGYFSTLQNNNGEIRGARFSPVATRNENGMQFPEIEKGFKSGRYGFNNRVRDRDCFLVDEERSAVMCRGFIDHKGVLEEVPLTDGTKAKSVYREPHTWAFLESFKVKNGMITAVEATFTGAPYYIRSPYTKKPDPVYDALK
ncbi:MAG TPA: hypothetical protein VN755_07120 [Steroidobacteraceae bacterium]|nr:hypothetical protein [Steroidobacteraceae bacterium]